VAGSSFTKKSAGMGQICHSFGRMHAKKLSASGGFAPCPWTLLGAKPPGPHYRLALHARHILPKMKLPSKSLDPQLRVLGIFS